MDYWEITGNPTGAVYENLMQVLCAHSDEFYFITRKELTYDRTVLDQFAPYMKNSYKTKTFAQTITKGPAATVYVIESSPDTLELLIKSANSLYDWVAPQLPEDMTFLKNNFEWFSCTTHEEQAIFSLRSEYYKQLVRNIDGLQVQEE
ncbi:hypothetical protein [Sporosarcina obsidiansis]|uniref:hypothetical protein n=1 Tax=Sporosarcina obsidiansis TaxID=2660748 RepID=UPI00129B4EFC|nr:hypothetical protein [Sporosarcina obsidiansis]